MARRPTKRPRRTIRWPTPQPIALEPLVVPDTDLEGVDADQIFNVTAADIVGYLGLDSSGQSNTDYYSFTAQAGTLINFQLMSAVLDRSASGTRRRYNQGLRHLSGHLQFERPGH